MQALNLINGNAWEPGRENLWPMLLAWITLLGLALGLAMDALAVAIGVGLTLGKVSGRQTFRLAFHFGLFQFFMPLLGWAMGMGISPWITRYDHWFAFLLLSYVGARMIYQACRPRERNSLPIRHGAGCWLLLQSLPVWMPLRWDWAGEWWRGTFG